VSRDVADPPAWDPRYNSERADGELLARAVRFVAGTLAATPPLRDMFVPGGRRMPEGLAVDSLEAAREVVRQRQIAAYHAVGSARMGAEATTSVVDARLRVYGVRGLRVVDASVFPLETLGNIQTVVYAVAERAADFIKEDWRT